MTLDLDACISNLKSGSLLSEAIIHSLCNSIKSLLISESNVVSISSPVTIVGDVHGQFYDLLEIFRIGGELPNTNYLFLGDYVDRGYHSVEVISLLLCYKLRYPSRITLLRGNHESRTITQVYGFYNECLKKYKSPSVWRSFTDIFDYLTLTVVIDNSLFAVHGGLSPSFSTIDELRVLDRFSEIPHDGPIADIMWSDPDTDKPDFAVSPRGAGFTFGSSIVEHFLARNGMNQIVRAHQLCMEGYQELWDGQLVTVWSAPNYCYRCGNKASILEVNDGRIVLNDDIYQGDDNEEEKEKEENNNQQKLIENTLIHSTSINRISTSINRIRVGSKTKKFDCYFNLFDAAPESFLAPKQEAPQYFL